jgi:hypothetical protein
LRLNSVAMHKLSLVSSIVALRISIRSVKEAVDGGIRIV